MATGLTYEGTEGELGRNCEMNGEEFMNETRNELGGKPRKVTYGRNW